MRIFTIIVLGVSSLFINSYNGEGINFNPRLLQKEMNTLMCGDEIRMQELLLSDSITSNIKVSGKFFTLLCDKGEKYHAYVGRVNSSRAVDYTHQKNNDPEGEYEYFDYFIIFDSLVQIKVVRVYNYDSTHGQEITAKSWLNQFIGFDGTKTLRVGKEIDSISGATISASGITDDIQVKTSILRSFLMTSRSQ